MKVAFATDDGVRVNAHFGQCSMFAIYNITKGKSELLELRRIPDIAAQDELGKIDGRIETIGDCTLIFLMQIGASAAAKVTR
ncbi:NifB/NifX family molybdenum-iron cluster-binding protein, partial [Paenibacillus zanthoxyli]|uniref:NifB/NifX family molybdenum-iron cluster-binding protein n=1 Tax=Paenibacillus zanthoxyli TaxID=369399 RepID=UPI000470E2E8